ncbi:IS30 family transposase [Moraxella bovis]|uniref:IS30 family transposase n=1 Tax=Moraxella bovis TaxID=476 RepID=UPI000DC7A227|nr:IS30 family transposase [Moraxella bovis]AWY21226.1 IS30 family transposase [Moraxella bovis]AWY21531.1 IS30 family transposase [Moraxella bovis]UYZ95727.1 IS30 family transposase [Moraxella bovis]UZA24456.1 IS30 family transposase [Moraxella bovis]UZA24769.1 IS30 family transposase [Moraxella bovis]
MNTYKHLSINEREKIMLMLAQGIKPSKIASMLGRSCSTISREISRNCKLNQAYSANTAQINYDKKRQACKLKFKLDDKELYQLVHDKFMSHRWSPEQISNRLRLENTKHQISANTIYRAIYHGWFDEGGRLARRKLRHKGKTRHAKTHDEKRGKIKISHELSERPKMADLRERTGDIEVDTVLGISGGHCLLTLVDRKSRYLWCRRLPAKRAEHVQTAMIDLLKDVKVHTITPDRGKEFAYHEKISQQLNVEFYFPPPRHPWDRGSNENTNGLLREYFPKHQDLSKWHESDIISKVNEPNHRPKKCLNWKTPYEVYFDEVLQLV